MDFSSEHWGARHRWPEDDQQTRRVFLGRALDQFGAHLYGERWTGVGYPHFDSMNPAHVAEAQALGFATLAEYAALLPSNPNWGPIVWDGAHELVRLLARGSIRAFVRDFGTGAYVALDAAAWADGRGLPMVRACASVGAGGSLGGWIFVDLDDLNGALEITPLPAPSVAALPVDAASRGDGGECEEAATPPIGRPLKYADDFLILSYKIEDVCKRPHAGQMSSIAIIEIALEEEMADRAINGRAPLNITISGISKASRENCIKKICKIMAEKTGRADWRKNPVPGSKK